MKNHASRLIFTIALSIAVLASFFAGTSTTSASELEIIEILLKGGTRLNGPRFEETFEVPVGYASTGIIEGWKMEGHPNLGCTPDVDINVHRYCDQGQDDEEIRVLLNGEVCFEHLDQNPADDQYFNFEEICRVREGTNVISVEHTGKQGQKPGSVEFDLRLQVYPSAPSICNLVNATINQQTMKVTGTGSGQGVAWRTVDPEGNLMDNGAGDQASFSFTGAYGVSYQLQFQNAAGQWSVDGCTFDFSSPSSPQACTLTTTKDGKGNTRVKLGAVDDAGNKVDIDLFKARSNFSYSYPPTPTDALPVRLRWPGADEGRWYVQFSVSADSGQSWLAGDNCRLERSRSLHTTGQYQDFVGPVAFGTYTPHLEPGKEHFDSTRSVMYNVEYIREDGQGEVVFRFNGQEVSHVTTSLFHAGTFNQIESSDGRATATFDDGVTKLIAYQYGAEQAYIFQTMSPTDTRWIHPLDQPFEHKYDFVLEVHGPPGVTDLLVYGEELRNLEYDRNGITIVHLTFEEPGPVAIYEQLAATSDLNWITVDSITYPITTSQKVHYQFSEVGLYHYRIVDHSGRIIAVATSSPDLTFRAEPGTTYHAQLVYPETSLFVGLYDDMKFEHPSYWTMPIDAHNEHDFEFHLDYHRLNDPDLGNDHIRGDVVVDALYLINGTTSVAQQFPHGRHDGTLPGVKIVGIPNVSMIAFCQRPGFHEVVYWGGWENEAYYLPDRSWLFDDQLYDEWTEGQRGDCIDAAHRVNMELARQGLRTDHTYRHHGEMSQGYQMTQLHIWSPYNLAEMRPPHLGQFLKPGTVLPYYEDPNDLLFWGWVLDKGGLADGLGVAELQAYVNSLGPVVYGDQTGIHAPEELDW